MSIKLSSTYSLITRTIKINVGPYAVKSPPEIYERKYTLRNLDLNLIFTIYIFFICFSWNHIRGGKGLTNSSIHGRNFSSEVMKKRKIFSRSKVELFKNI